MMLHPRLARPLHDWLVRDILRTPPLSLRPGPATIVTMLCERDVLQYLVAIKSLYRFIGKGGVEIVDDGSLSPESRATIAAHVPGIQFHQASEVNVGACPHGGCWERLMFVIDRSKAGYVVQMDADTLTLGPIPEVVSCIEGNLAFTQGTPEGTKLVSAREAAAFARGKEKYLQWAAEAALDRLPEADQLRYVRGCAGFAGFAKGRFERSMAEDISTKMEQALGRFWHEWGSEQFASNFVIANSPGGVVLPVDRYDSYFPGTDVTKTAFLHFIGTHRFRWHTYSRLSRRVIAELLAA